MKEKATKFEYDFWNRLVLEFKAAIDKAETELEVNLFYLEGARNMRSQFKKPKENNPIVK